jgi:hypothetical protein
MMRGGSGDVMGGGPPGRKTTNAMKHDKGNTASKLLGGMKKDIMAAQKAEQEKHKREFEMERERAL